jgi:hypothetical protein
MDGFSGRVAASDGLVVGLRAPLTDYHVGHLSGARRGRQPFRNRFNRDQFRSLEKLVRAFDRNRRDCFALCRRSETAVAAHAGVVSLV